jgi:hypothetical protein
MHELPGIFELRRTIDEEPGIGERQMWEGPRAGVRQNSAQWGISVLFIAWYMC